MSFVVVPTGALCSYHLWTSVDRGANEVASSLLAGSQIGGSKISRHVW